MGKKISTLQSEPHTWFSHNVTKTQTKKLSVLPSFYFHVVLQHLNTFIQTNCRFKRPGCFVLRHWSLEIPDFCMTQHLADGQKMKALMWVKNITDFGRFCYSCLRINITLIFMSSSSAEFTH